MLRFIGVLFLTGIIVVGALSATFVWDSYFASPESEEIVTVTIDPGESVKAISQKLFDLDIINSRFLFEQFVKHSGRDRSFQPGEFSLKPGGNYQEIVAILTYIEAKEKQVTIPEGYTAVQIGEQMREAFEGIDTEEWERVSGPESPYKKSNRLLVGVPKDQGLEGYLFPDTYRFIVDDSADPIVETMLATLERRMEEQGIEVPESLVFENGMTLHEVITLASIVEREVQSSKDMALVAGIFHSRLEIGMALQADSTVNYVTGKSDPGVTIADSKVDSPYNTYQNLGLPPGPISNPGIRAIEAVLNPEDSEYLYFLTTPEGEVKYAKTFQGHINNRQYLR